MRRLPSSTSCKSQIPGAKCVAENSHLTGRVVNGFRNILQSAFFKRANTSVRAAIYRRKTVKDLLGGNATPFLALVGVTLASGPGIVTKQDELDFVCREIQRSAKKTLFSEDENDEFVREVDNKDQNDETTSSESTLTDSNYSWGLKDFEIGSVIAKGCNAVVKAARINETAKNNLNTLISGLLNGFDQMGHNQRPSLIEEAKSQGASDIGQNDDEASEDTSGIQLEQQPSKKINSICQDKDYPLAIKQLFNYDVESNAQVIFRAMYKEIVVARNCSLPDEIEIWTRGLHSRKKTLPAHPNIIEMPLAFADFIQGSSEAMHLYPDALPQRLNPNGVGRNMSLFLVMKRYDCTLKEFLKSFQGTDGKFHLSWKKSLVLLTQLLEGINHMVENEIAHRDLKTDNILVNKAPPIENEKPEKKNSSNCGFPHLVITDFGCCLADSEIGLKLPYNSCEIDRGGNMALMAPEVLNAEPGVWSKIDYSKADVWAAGAIAYELFGAPNPLYARTRLKTNGKKRTLLNRYESDLYALVGFDVPCYYILYSFSLNILHLLLKQR